MCNVCEFDSGDTEIGFSRCRMTKRFRLIPSQAGAEYKKLDITRVSYIERQVQIQTVRHFLWEAGGAH